MYDKGFTIFVNWGLDLKDFVDYLNTLHRMSGNNSNATAESNFNKKNKKYADSILVRDESLIEEIKESIKKDHKILLTGFAGDGKTTIANMIAGFPLVSARTVIPMDNRDLIIIKDLSEIASNDIFLYEDIFNPDIDLLIVSNTGTIKKRLTEFFDIFRKEERFGSRLNLESAILKGIECDENRYTGEISFEDGELILKTFNLVKRDNLELAEKIFKKILDHPEWDTGTLQEAHSIPFLNRQLLRADNYLGLKRMMYIYRRIHEYGNRMTIRNLIEHFCFSLTGNHLVTHEFKYGKSFDGLFFVNFFSREAAKTGMVGALLADGAKFGYNIDASWKRRIWIGINPEEFKIDFSNDKVSYLYQNIQDKTKRLRSDHTGRLNVMRLIFFLNISFEDDSKESWMFFNSFLNSPGFNYFIGINRTGNLDYSDRQLISIKIRQVIKEYFIGMKIPESSSSHNSEKIYIAMARNSSKIKQTAQIILESFTWKSTSKILDIYKDHRGIYQFCLKIPEYGTERIELPLPFVDYLLSCHLGIISDPSFATYRKRLDNIRDGILKNAGHDEDSTLVIAYMDRKKDLHITTFVKQDGKIYYEEGE